MNKRLIFVLGLVGCLAVAGLLKFVLFRRDIRTGREHFEALGVGMTRKDVERVLGGPARNESSGHAIVWVPRSDGRSYSSDLHAGAPEVSFFAQLAEGEQERVWVTHAGLIAVCFGVDGRLRDKYFSTVHEPGGPSGPLRWLAREDKVRPNP